MEDTFFQQAEAGNFIINQATSRFWESSFLPAEQAFSRADTNCILSKFYRKNNLFDGYC